MLCNVSIVAWLYFFFTSLSEPIARYQGSHSLTRDDVVARTTGSPGLLTGPSCGEKEKWRIVATRLMVA
jgi:hypothetical protein